MELIQEVIHILYFMQHNDPDGYYCIWGIIAYPVEHAKLLQQWREDLGYGNEVCKQRLDDMISTLYALHVIQLSRKDSLC